MNKHIGKVFYCSSSDKILVIRDRISTMYFADFGNKYYSRCLTLPFKKYDNLVYLGRL